MNLEPSNESVSSIHELLTDYQLPAEVRLTDPIATLDVPPRLLRVLRLEGVRAVADLLWFPAKRLHAMPSLAARQGILIMQARLWQAVRQGRLEVDPATPWDQALGPLPLRVRKVLGAEGLRTIAEVAWAYRSGKLRPRPNFSRISLETLGNLLQRLGVLEMDYDPMLEPHCLSPEAEGWLAGMRAHGIDPSRPWGDVLGAQLPVRAAAALRAFDVVTVEQAVAMVDARALLQAPNFGRVSLTALRQEFEQLARHGVPAGLVASPGGPPRDVAELVEVALKCPQLREIDRDLLRRRLFAGTSLRDLGQQSGVSRERARQRVEALLARLRRLYGEGAQRLLGGVVTALREQGGLLHRGEVQRLCGADDLRAVMFGLRLCGERAPAVFAGEFLSAHRLDDLNRRLRAFRAALGNPPHRPGACVPLAQAQALLARTTGLKQPEGPLRLLLTAHLDLTVEDGGVRVPAKQQGAGEVVAGRLCDLLEFARRPMSADELAAAYNTAAQDQGPGAGGQECTPALVRRLLRGHPDAYRSAARTYLHRLYLPLTPEQVTRIGAFCAPLLREAGAGVVGVDYLLRRLASSDLGLPAAVLTRALLQDILHRVPGIRAVGPRHLCPQGDNSRLRGTGPAIERILRDASTPLRAGEVLDRLPASLGLQQVTVLAHLRRGAFAVMVEGQRYVHLGHLGLDPEDCPRLARLCHDLLPADGRVMGLRALAGRLRDRLPKLRLPDTEVGAATALGSLLRHDPRVRADTGGLAARAEGEPPFVGRAARAPLVYRAMAELYRAGQPFSLAIFRERLAHLYGYAASTAVFDGHVRRCVALGLLRKQGPGHYVRCAPVDSRAAEKYAEPHASSADRPQPGG